MKWSGLSSSSSNVSCGNPYSMSQSRASTLIDQLSESRFKLNEAKKSILDMNMGEISSLIKNTNQSNYNEVYSNSLTQLSLKTFHEPVKGEMYKTNFISSEILNKSLMYRPDGKPQSNIKSTNDTYNTYNVTRKRKPIFQPKEIKYGTIRESKSWYEKIFSSCLGDDNVQR
jgi:hypothetical protein